MTQTRNTVFVAPFFQETTLRLINAVAGLPGVRLTVVCQDAPERIPAELRRLLSVARIADALDVDQIGQAIQDTASTHGPVDRLLGALEELQVPLGELRDRFEITGMGADAARNFRDKSRMKDVLRASGLPCARHALVADSQAAQAFANDVGFPLVAKPPAGSGARSTFRLQDTEQLTQCLSAMPPSGDRPLLLEEFMTGTEHSFDSVYVDGQMVFRSISHYEPAPLEVLNAPWIQWTVMIPREVDRPEYDEIVQTAPAALDALGMENGLSHMEWFRRPDGSIAISEVGARPPGAQIVKLISYAHDFDLYKAWARLMVFDEFEHRERPYAAGAAYLRGQGRGKVAAITGLKDLYADIGELVVEHKLPQEGQSPNPGYEGDGYIIVRHPDTDVVRATLLDIISRVRVVLSQGKATQ